MALMHEIHKCHIFYVIFLKNNQIIIVTPFFITPLYIPMQVTYFQLPIHAKLINYTCCRMYKVGFFHGI